MSFDILLFARIKSSLLNSAEFEQARELACAAAESGASRGLDLWSALGEAVLAK